MKSLNLLLITIIIPFIYSCAKESDSPESTKQNASPSSHVKMTTLASESTSCTYGGVKIEMGIDDNMNGTLDSSEVDKTEYVCNGATGSTGSTGATGATGATGSAGDNATALNTLMSVENESSGSNCTSGGKKVNYGIDDNSDGTLASTEVDGSTYICNGLSDIDIGFLWKGTATLQRPE